MRDSADRGAQKAAFAGATPASGASEHARVAVVRKSGEAPARGRFSRRGTPQVRRRRVRYVVALAGERGAPPIRPGLSQHARRAIRAKQSSDQCLEWTERRPRCRAYSGGDVCQRRSGCAGTALRPRPLWRHLRDREGREGVGEGQLIWSRSPKRMKVPARLRSSSGCSGKRS